METRLSSGEEGQASSLPTSSEAQTHQSGREEKGTSTSQPYLELLEERSRLEDRVSILENRLHTLELPRLSDFSEKGDGSSERSGLSVEPQWMTWQEYLEPTNKATNILEVLIEKPHTNTRRRSYVIKPANDAQSGIPEVKNIERIRFRSIHIVNALQQITEQTFPSLSCFTIHRPFKILLFYRDAIEEYVSELEENFRQYTFCALGDQCRACIHREDPIVRSPTKYQSMPEAQRAEYRSRRRASSGEHVWGPGQVFEANNGSHRPLEVQRHVFDTAGVENVYPSAGLDDSECRHEDSDDLLAQSEALTHLRALLKFMREDMREIFGRHDLLRSSHAGQISFINIWHLFMAGDLVVTNDVSNRMIYRVSILPAHQFFSSRRPVKEMKLKSDGSHQQVESVYTQESMSVMNIDVFHYNFDGRNFGPVETRYVVTGESDKRCKGNEAKYLFTPIYEC